MTRYNGTLTADQIAEAQATASEWLQIGLSTERCDRPATEKAIAHAYRTAGFEPPAITIWMDSPLGGCLAKAFIRGQLGDQLWGQLGGQLGGQLWGQLGDQLWGQLGDQLGGQLGDQLWGQLRGQLWGQLGGQLWGQLRGQLGDQLWGQLGGQLWGQLGDQLWGQLGGQLGDQLGGQLWGQLRGQLWGQLGGQLRGQLRGQLWGQLWGQLGGQLWGQLGDQLGGQLGDQFSWWWDSYWLAIYRHALPAAELPTSERLDALIAAVRSAGWWWPMHGAVVVTDRPTELNLDNLGRLHHERGPALAYADSYSLHAWHGTRVPPDLIETGWDTTRILQETNTEIRRCAIERLGWDQFALDAGLKVVDEQPDPANGDQRLRLCDVPSKIYGTPVRVLLCVNGSPERDGTRRRFGLTVPADINDAVHAAAWTYDLEKSDYAQLARRT